VTRLIREEGTTGSWMIRGFIGRSDLISGALLSFGESSIKIAIATDELTASRGFLSFGLARHCSKSFKSFAP